VRDQAIFQARRLAWEILLGYLYQDNPMACARAYAGLRLIDARAITGPPGAWLRIPVRDYRQ
jgi:hypothetical protein